MGLGQSQLAVDKGEAIQMVILKKGLTDRTYRFLQAAEFIGGPGHGWTARFVDIVKRAAEPASGQDATFVAPPISVSRMHNLLAGHREVTPALELVILALFERSARQMEENARQLREISSKIAADMTDKNDP
jgi:hypothetical protein